MNTLQSDETPKIYGAYSPVRRAGALAFVSGQIGIDPLSGHLDEDPAKQAAQALRNVESALGSAGMGLDDVVDTTVFVTNMGTFPEINELYRDVFGEPYPSRTFVAVSELPRLGGDRTVQVEIKAIAMGQPK